jgi:hypothetical protein
MSPVIPSSSSFRNSGMSKNPVGVEGRVGRFVSRCAGVAIPGEARGRDDAPASLETASVQLLRRGSVRVWALISWCSTGNAARNPTVPSVRRQSTIGLLSFESWLHCKVCETLPDASRKRGSQEGLQKMATLLRQVTPLTRRDVVYFYSGAHISYRGGQGNAPSIRTWAERTRNLPNRSHSAQISVLLWEICNPTFTPLYDFHHAPYPS